MPSTSPAAPSPRRCAPASTWSRSSAACSPPSPARCRCSSTSRCAARSPRTTCRCWELAALKGLFTDVTEDPVTYVNAPLLAKERGCESRLVTDEVSEDFRNVTTLHGTLADGTTVSVAGTLTGPKMVQKLIGINGYDLEIPISTHMAFFAYEDRPGVIGAVGKLLGEADVNIAGMQVSRDDDAAKALIALTVDQAIPLDVVAAIEKEIGAETVRVVDLV